MDHVQSGSPRKVLISGGGIAGPTLAWWLARLGMQVTVVEKAPKLLPYGQNIDIKGSAVKVIEKMGLREEVKKRNTSEQGTQFVDDKGRPFAQFPVGPHLSPTAELEILRGDLAILLNNATADHQNITYLFDTTVVGVVQKDSTVEVQLSDNSIHQIDLLVIADGQWSKLRKECFSEEDVTVIDKDLYIAYYTVPRTERDNNWWNVYQAVGSRTIGIRPDPYGTARATFSRMPLNTAQREAWRNAMRSGREMQEELLTNDFADAGWEAPRLLAALRTADDFYFQDVKQIRMKRWSAGPVVCLGDTAYAPTPLSGMGTALAILGAYVLAGELSEAENDLGLALENYDAVFRPFTDKVQDLPSFVPAIAHPEKLWKLRLLQSVILVASKFLALPGVAKGLGYLFANKDDDFKLPVYPRLEQALNGHSSHDL